MKAIVIYYSKSGVTEKLANRIQSSLDCDILKIEPEKEYGNYISAVSRVAKEMVTRKTPAFITPIPNLTQYDIILVGYPVWYHKVPAFVADFLKSCNMDNKKIIPFATFGGTGVQWTMKSLKVSLPDTAEILLPFNWGILKKDNYDEWINNIKLIK